jgi:cytoskeletal protein RodZ
MFEIGNTLREARLRRRLDLSRCESDTKIRSKYLRAMEEEQFDLLPGRTYVRGFLRTYAEYLGLDWQLVLDEYESRFGAFAEAGWDGEGGSQGRRRPHDRGRRPRRERSRSPEARLLWLAVGGVLSVALLVWLGVGSPDESSRTLPAPVAPAVSQARAALVRIEGVGEGAEVAVRARNGRGRLIFAGPLQAGESRRYAVARSIWLRVSDPAGVRLTVDGVERPLPTEGAYLVTPAGPRAAPAP